MSKDSKKAKPTTRLDEASVRSGVKKRDTKIEVPLTKSMATHPHSKVCEWFVARGLKERHKDASLFEAFEHAMANSGRIRKGILIGSPEHAAALAGASIWRSKNPTSGKGGPGRGQGRKAKDGETNLVRVSVNLRADQKEPFKKCGGSVWLRTELDKFIAMQKG